MVDDRKRAEGLRQLQRGLALERANRTEEAANCYRLAIESNPHLREAHNALGFYYQRSGLLAKAADAFRTVATLESDFLAYFNLGYVLVELERYEEAVDAFAQCLALAPDDSATHFELSLIYLSRGEYTEALNHLQLPLRSYPEDWEVHNLLGRCLLGLRRYDEAVAALGRSLLLAGTPYAQAEVIDNINTVERHREFRNLNTVKDQLYAEDGVIYLGSASDDGLQVSETHDFHFTYPDIATTLQRLIALAASAGWHFSAIVAADTLARPLAEALSTLLETPLRTAEKLGEADRILLVFAVAREAELLLLTVERLPCVATAFCLGLNWMRHSKILPDLVGIAAHGLCSVPWESELRRLRADGAPAAQVTACIATAATAIVAAVRDTPIDPNLARQIRYYTRTHRRVNVIGH
ncbi:MAG: tetratricopeptide repeat protein [Chloroflexales bacterium]|nr:tetratricopeptide repeat protein [Chloroflexales bacterium]